MEGFADVEADEQRICRTHGWMCACHTTPPPPWPSGHRPALRCPICGHPDLAQADMPGWFTLWCQHTGRAEESTPSTTPPDRLRAIEAWLQREDEELLYEPQGEPQSPAPGEHRYAVAIRSRETGEVLVAVVVGEEAWEHDGITSQPCEYFHYTFDLHVPPFRPPPHFEPPRRDITLTLDRATAQPLLDRRASLHRYRGIVIEQGGPCTTYAYHEIVDVSVILHGDEERVKLVLALDRTPPTAVPGADDAVCMDFPAEACEEWPESEAIRNALHGFICVSCLGAPAVRLVPHPWGGPMGVCARWPACRGEGG